MELYLPPAIKNNGRFIKGSVPWNKGTKGLTKPNSTSFKKGNKTKNYRPVGAISLRKRYKRQKQDYYYIKVGEPNIWKPYHRYLWEQKYGPIPAGLLLIFKDGNHLNCTKDCSNFKLISRSIHGKRNINPKKQAKAMLRLWEDERRRKAKGLKPLTKLPVKDGNRNKRKRAVNIPDTNIRGNATPYLVYQ